jgi:hypothetical protein
VGLQATEIRHLYRIKGSALGDGCKALCCPLCTLAQNDREIRLQAELHPPVAFMPPLIPVEPTLGQPPSGQGVMVPMEELILRRSSSSTVARRQPDPPAPMQYPEAEVGDSHEQGQMEESDSEGAVDSEKAEPKSDYKDTNAAKCSCKARPAGPCPCKRPLVQTSKPSSWLRNLFSFSSAPSEGPLTAQQESVARVQTWPRAHSMANLAQIPEIAVIPPSNAAKIVAVTENTTETGVCKKKSSLYRRHAGGMSSDGAHEDADTARPDSGQAVASTVYDLSCSDKVDSQTPSSPDNAVASPESISGSHGHGAARDTADGPRKRDKKQKKNTVKDDKPPPTSSELTTDSTGGLAHSPMASSTKSRLAKPVSAAHALRDDPMVPARHHPEEHRLSVDTMVPAPARPAGHVLSSDEDDEPTTNDDDDSGENPASKDAGKAVSAGGGASLPQQQQHRDARVPSPVPPRVHQLSEDAVVSGPSEVQRHSLGQDILVAAHGAGTPGTHDLADDVTVPRKQSGIFRTLTLPRSRKGAAAGAGDVVAGVTEAVRTENPGRHSSRRCSE